MGSKYEFCCPKCQHTLESGIGEDWGMKGFYRTHYCQSCHNVFEIFTDRFTQDLSEDISRHDHESAAKGEVCPKCKGRQIAFWDPKRPCPKCGTKMKKGDLVCLWD